MAKKEEKKVELERVYNIPLRKEYRKAPKWKRTHKASRALREFISKHMKSENVKIGKYLNLELWKHGIKNPPHHVKVNCTKDSEGKVMAELVGAPKEVPKEPRKKVAKKDEEVEIKVKDALGEEKKSEKLEEKAETKEEKSEKAKAIQKEEIKELKKENLQKKAPKQPVAQKNIQQRPNAPIKKG